MLAAVSKDDFMNSLICGTCLRISIIDLSTRDDPDDVFAVVVDQCNDCQKGKSRGAPKITTESIN